MKFKFAFENVRKHRKILEDLAQREFQEKLSELNHEIQKNEDMKQAIQQARDRAFEVQVGGGQPGPSLSQVDEFIKLQDVRIERQQNKVQEIEKQVEELREILRQKAIDYKMIESLKERKKHDFRKEMNKIEQKRADDNSTLRFVANAKKKND